MAKELTSIDFDPAAKKYVLKYSDNTTDLKTEAEYVSYISTHGLARPK